MKCAEINQKGLSELDIEKELEKVEYGVGTYEEIAEAIDAGVITLLKDSEDNLIGISYNLGKTGVEDILEGLKFEKRFVGHDVIAYVYKALTGNDIYAEESVDELPDELPSELILRIEEDLGGVVSGKAIASYLRNTYNHYLSGKESQFTFAVDVDDDKFAYIENIKWGRKR